MTKGKEAGRIQVYVRVRPFTDKEKERREPNAIEIHNEHSLIRVLDKWRESNYFYDGVFGPEAKNEEVYNQVGKPLVHAALNGYKGTLLTYGQTGTGKTYTLLSDGGVTTRLVSHCFDRIRQDEIHNYRVTCSFLQVYQEKVYDLLNTRFVIDLPVREHPKKGVYVANLSLHEVRNEEEVFGLLEIGKKQLVIAETKMVRHSSRSHSIIQLIFERRLKANIVNNKTPSEAEEDHSPETVQESIMAVDETISNLLKELKQDRKSHHKGDRECLKELMDKKLNEDAALDDFIVKGKINLCDLAGSERLTKTKAEGVRLTEAKYLNTSLLELGNVIHALARGNKGHVPYRNSTLTRLLQDCLGDNGKTNFIVCIAPSLSEVNETKCSLNFGLRAMRITNVARLSVEVDYKVLAERLARKLDDQDRRHKFEKLEYLREIQRLKSEVTLFRDTEHYGDRDTDKLVTVIANLSKSVQREKEQKKCLQSELVCIKRQISHPVSGSSHDVEALLLAEVLSMQMLASLNPDDIAGPYTAETLHTRRAKDYMSYRKTQETFLTNAEGLVKLMESFLDTSETCEGKPLEENSKSQAVSKVEETNGSKGNDYFRFNFSQAGAVELFSKDCSIKISPRGGGYDPCTGPIQNSDDDSNAWQGVKKIIGKLVTGSPSSSDSAPPAPGDSNQVPLDTRHLRPKSWSMSDEKQNGGTENKVSVLVKHLATSKRKIERQICNLLAVVFDEQLAKDDGELPQWQEIGKKLSDLVLFKRNNVISPTDLLDSQEDESGSLMEKCLHYVIMDKALLSCLLVLELAQLRQKVPQHCTCMKFGDQRSREQSITDSKQNRGQEKMPQGQNSPSSKNETTTKSSKRSKRPESLSCKSPHSNSQQNIKQPSTLPIREGLDAAVSSPEGELAGKSPNELATDLVQYRQSKRELRSELREINEDTCQLETEVFASMEEKTRLEEELIYLKDTVYRLKSELFHLKLEKSNLENDLLKSKPAEGSDRESDQQSQIVSDRTVGVLTTELSDVLEVSQESVDSENSSQMSEGNEQRESFLKSCLASMSHVYTLVPSPEDDTLTEEDITETEGHSQDDGSVTDTDILDSDEDIVITKLARAAQEAQPNAHGKAKRTKAGSSAAKSPLKSPTSLSGFPAGKKSSRGHIIVDGAETEDFNITITDQEALQSELKKALREVKGLCASCNSLEEELIKAAIQLSEANQKVEDLQTELNEEKQSCEEIRISYMDVKDKNDVLENKVVTLRGELERVLQENEGFVDFHSSMQLKDPGNLSKEAETSRAKSPSQASVKSRTRSPSRNQSPSKTQPKNYQGKITPKKKSIDLRTPPQQKEDPPRQLRLIHISEENAELKTKLEKLVQEKQLMDKKRVGNEDYLDQLQQALSTVEKDLKKAMEELSQETKRNVELQKELDEKKIVISNLVNELQGRMKKTKPTDAAKIDDELSQIKLQLSKTSEELEWQRSKANKLEKEIETSNYLNEDLECNNSTLEGQVAKLEGDILKWKNELDSVVSECQIFEAELALSKKQQFDIRKEMEVLRTDNERLGEENSFLKELKRKLEIDYQQRKERTKVAEGETLQLQRANSELRSKLDSLQEYQDQLRSECSKAKDGAETNIPAQQKDKAKELEQTPEIVHQPDEKHEKNNTEINAENKRRTGIPKPIERRKNRERSPSTRGARYPEPKMASKVVVLEIPLAKNDEDTQNLSKVKQQASKDTCIETSQQRPNQTCSENTRSSNEKQISDNQTAKLQRQLLELEKVLSMYKMDLDKAHAKTESLTTELELAHAERKDLERRLADKEKLADEFDIESYKDLQERYETLTTEYTALLEENSKLQLRLLDVDKERDGIKDGLSHVETENNELKQQLVAVDSNRIQLEMRVQELELKSKDWDRDVSHVQAENERLNELVNQLKGEDKKLTEMLETKEYENKMLQGTSIEEQRKRQGVEEDLAEARNEITKLEMDLKQAISEKEKKQLRLTQSENDRDALKTQLNDNIEKAASLEIQLMEIRCFNDGLSQELEHTKELERQDGYKLQEATVSRDLMEKRLTEALKSSQTLQNDLKECQEKVRDLTERVILFKSQAEQSQDIQSKKNESDELLQKQIKEDLVKINNLECLLSASKTRVNELTQHTTVLEKELSQAKETVNVKQDEFTQLEKKMTNVVSENDNLHKQLESSAMQAKEFAAKLMSLEAQITSAKNDAGDRQKQLELAEKRLVEELKKTQNLESDKLTCENKLEEFENRVSVLVCEVKQAKEALDSEKVRNEQLEKQEQELLQKNKKQCDEINEAKKETDKLKRKLNNMNSETSQLIERIDAQRKEINIMEKNYGDTLQTNQNLRNDLENTEKHLRVLEGVERNLKNKEQELCDKETEIENLKKELELSDSGNSALRTKSRALKGELSVFHEERSSLTQEEGGVHKEFQDTNETERKINEELKENIAKLETELKSVNEKNTELQQLLASEGNPSNVSKDKLKRIPEKLTVDKNKQVIKKDGKRKKSMSPTKKNDKNETESRFDKKEMSNQNVSETNAHFINIEKDNNKTPVNEQRTLLQPTTTKDATMMKPESENARSDQGMSRVELTTTMDENVNLSKSLQSSVCSSLDDASLETVHEHPEKDSITIEAMETKICKMAKESLLFENKTARKYLKFEQALAKAAGQNDELSKQLADSKDDNRQLKKLINDIKQNGKAECTLAENAISEQRMTIEPSDDVSEPNRSSHTTMNTYTQTNTDNLHLEMEETKPTVNEVAVQVHLHTRSEMADGSQSSQVSVSNEKPKVSVSVACSETSSCSTHTGNVSLSNAPAMSPESKDHLVYENAIIENICDASGDTGLIQEERDILVDELKEIKERKKQLENDLQETKVASVKLQEDHKLLLASYRQEKETLLMEIEVNRNEVKEMKMKLAELNESKALIEGLQRRSEEAEKLISEFEKNLMEQSNAKSEVEKDLWACQNKIKDMLELEQKLKVLTCENDEMAIVIQQFKEINSEKESKESSCQTTQYRQENVATQAVSVLNSNSEELQTEDQLQPVTENSSIPETKETKESAVQVELMKSPPVDNARDEIETLLEGIGSFGNNTVNITKTDVVNVASTEHVSATPIRFEIENRTVETTTESDKKVEYRRTEGQEVEELESHSDTQRTLTSRVDELQHENKDLVTERMTEDEEKSQLQNSLAEALKDVKQARQEIKRLRSEKASVEIQLSDAVEEKSTMEEEFLRAKQEAEEIVRDELGKKNRELSERYSKLETVLSCVLEENARVETQVTTLREENAMLRDYKITEVSDTCTQITPRSTEDEEEDELETDKSNKKRITKSKHNSRSEFVVNVLDSTDDASFSSAETQTPTSTCAPNSHDHETLSSLCNSSNESTVSSQDSVREGSKKNTIDNSPLSSPQQSENLSMAVCTDSSQLGSVSELESPSSSSDVTSASEDSSYPSKHAFDSVNRLSSEIAQLKCDNTILENNLSIVKGQNSDLQSQVQKHVSRNHGLKQKVCDRTIAVKKLEREVQKVHEDNKQLQDQTSEIREELNKVEREKIKLERNLAAAKAEVKKTKMDLSYTRAECYNTMKAFTNLQIQYKKLRAKLDKVKAELCKRKDLAQEDCETESDKSLSSWASMSLTDLSYDISPTSSLSRNEFLMVSETSLSPSSETSLNLESESKRRPDSTNKEEVGKTDNNVHSSRNLRANFKRTVTDPSLKAHSDQEESKMENELMLNLSRNQIRDDQSLTLMKNSHFAFTRVPAFPSQRAKSDTSFSSQAKKSPEHSSFFRGSMSSAHLNAGPDWRFSLDSDLSAGSQGSSSSQGSPGEERDRTLGQRTLNGDQNSSPDSVSEEGSQPEPTKAKNKKIKTILKKFNMGRKNK